MLVRRANHCTTRDQCSTVLFPTLCFRVVTLLMAMAGEVKGRCDVPCISSFAIYIDIDIISNKPTMFTVFMERSSRMKTLI